jgi:hypothetical protein
MPTPSLAQQIDELVLEQIRTFKESVTMDDEGILEYHLRHYQIMTLYKEMDRHRKPGVRSEGSLSCGSLP